MWMWPNDPAVTHSAHLPQRGTEGGDRGGGVLRAEEEKVGFRSGVGAKCSGGSGVLEQLRTEWRKERMRLHANFEFTFAQMCCLVPKSFSGFAPQPPSILSSCPPPFLPTQHTPTHTNTLTQIPQEQNVLLLAWGWSIQKHPVVVSLNLKPFQASYGK